MPIIGFGPVIPYPILSCRVGFGSNLVLGTYFLVNGLQAGWTYTAV